MSPFMHYHHTVRVPCECEGKDPDCPKCSGTGRKLALVEPPPQVMFWCALAVVIMYSAFFYATVKWIN